jgi:hypothetical protein
MQLWVPCTVAVAVAVDVEMCRFDLGWNVECGFNNVCMMHVHMLSLGYTEIDCDEKGAV